MYKNFLIGNFAVMTTLLLTKSCSCDGECGISQDISIER